MTDPTPPVGAPDAPPPPPPAAPAAGPATDTPPGAPAGGSRFFAWLRSLNLTREPGWLGGIASGIALRLRIDPLLVRGILVVLAILAFPVALLYALAWAFLPDHTGKIHAEEVSRGRVESGFIGAAVLFGLALLGLGDGGPWVWNDGYGWGYGDGSNWFGAIIALFWTALVVGGITWLIVWIVRRSKTSAATQAQGAPGATFVAGAGAASTTTAPTTAAADATATAPIPGVVPDSDMDAWRTQQSADRAQRDAFVSADEAARRQAEADRLAAERRARLAEVEHQRALRRRTRSNPLYSVAAIGLALVAGAITTLTLGGTEVERGDVVVGFAVALGVLGAAIIINGVRGKRSGGSTGAAIIVLIGLSIASISPGTGSGLRVVGSGDYSPQFTDDEEQSFVVGAGATRIDLSDYWDGTRAGSDLAGTITVVSGAGDVTIELPDQGSVEWEIISGAGDAVFVDGEDEGERIPREGGISAFSDSERMLTLEVIAGAGDIRFSTEGMDR